MGLITFKYLDGYHCDIHWYIFNLDNVFLRFLFYFFLNVSFFFFFFPFTFSFTLQPYLTSTRSLSPMSGLFGSIWAPQSDVYENCCPINPTREHSTHMENQAVMCKEYYPGFNPFRAYMNLDIWTTTANRNANFPLSRDSSYCGNV